MKTKIIRSLVLTAVLAACALAETPFQSFTLHVAPGSSPAAVQRALGVPSATLGRDLWVYADFAKSNPNAGSPEFDTLVIAFTDGRVTAVKITDGRVVHRLIAQYKEQSARAAQTSIAAK